MIICMIDDGWLDGGAEVIPIDEHAALCLAASECGSPLWRALVEGTTFEKLVAEVTELYASSSDRLAADVDALLAAFGERGLLHG
jgi:coenzyme PQQ synthesis protein D (PqqD)